MGKKEKGENFGGKVRFRINDVEKMKKDSWRRISGKRTNLSEINIVNVT